MSQYVRYPNTSGVPTGGTANQLIGENAGATALEFKTLAGTSNQLTVTNAPNLITLSLPVLVNIANQLNVGSSSGFPSEPGKIFASNINSLITRMGGVSSTASFNFQDVSGNDLGGMHQDVGVANQVYFYSTAGGGGTSLNNITFDLRNLRADIRFNNATGSNSLLWDTDGGGSIGSRDNGSTLNRPKALYLFNINSPSILWSGANNISANIEFDNANIAGFANLITNVVANTGISGRHTFRINGTNRLELGASSISGSEYAYFASPLGFSSDNTYDFGSTDNTTAGARPRNIFAGTKVVAPIVTGGTTAATNLYLTSSTHFTKGFIGVQDESPVVLSNTNAYTAAGLFSYEGTPLQIAGDGQKAYAVLSTVLSSGSDTGSTLVLAGGKGTFASPDYLDDGQEAGSVAFTAADTTTPDAYGLATIQATAALDQSNTNHGANLNIFVTKTNSSDDQRLLQLNGSNGQMISDFSIIMRNSADPGGVASTDIAIYPATASISGVSTLGLRTAQAVAADAALVSTNSLKVWINGVEYKILLTAV